MTFPQIRVEKTVDDLLVFIFDKKFLHISILPWTHLHQDKNIP